MDRIEGPVVKVRARLNNARKDKTFHAPRLQELPAVYANATFNRVLSYTGAEPFQGVKSPHPKAQGKHPWTNWLATSIGPPDERQRLGIGVITPNRIHFTGGFAGRLVPMRPWETALAIWRVNPRRSSTTTSNLSSDMSCCWGR